MSGPDFLVTGRIRIKIINLQYFGNLELQSFQSSTHFVTIKPEKMAALIVTSILKQKMYINSFDIPSRTDNFMPLTVD
jgi:hypothetical protein